MKWNRSTLIGAGVGLALGMPLFEVFLLTSLAIDGEWFDAAVTIQYFSKSANLIFLLLLLHLTAGLIGAAAGTLIGRMKGRRRRPRVLRSAASRPR